MSYSLDFRRHVFKIKDKEGLSFQETGERFGISIRTLFRWNNQMEPKTTREKPATKIDMNVLKKHVEDYPDAYQHERAAVFGVSKSCIYYALQRLAITHKKNTISSQS